MRTRIVKNLEQLFAMRENIQGFSQEDVAKYLGLPRSAISLIETGARGVDVLELRKLATLYRCSIEELTGKSALRSEPDSVKMVARAAARALTRRSERGAAFCTVSPVTEVGEIAVASWREEVLEATKEAARVLNRFPVGSRTSFDIIRAVTELEIPLVFRPLKGLWGATVTRKPGYVVFWSPRNSIFMCRDLLSLMS